MSIQTRSAGVAALFVLSLLLSCNDDTGPFEPEPQVLPDAYCCPSWLGTDSLLIYRNEGLAPSADVGLWVSRLDQSESWMCLKGRVYTPSYSRAARALAFESSTQIFTADVRDGVVDTASIRQLTDDGGFYVPAWSPDGTWIAYDRRYCDLDGTDADTTCGVFVMRPNGSGQRLVARGVYPSWSPSGTELIFVTQGEVYAIDFPSVTGLRQVSSLQTIFPRPVGVLSPSYSPDGGSILVEVRTRPGAELWLMSLDVGTARPLIGGRWPAWSPSGDLVAFIRYGDADPEKDGTVWLLDMNSRQAKQFTSR